MDYAIQLQRINLGDDRVLFKPINLIKGKFLKDIEIFVDERGFEYLLMKDDTSDYERYFCCPTTMEELRRPYGNKLTDDEILDEFLTNFLDSCFLGIYDSVNEVTNVVEINFYDIESFIKEGEKKPDNYSEIMTEFDSENNLMFNFSLEQLKQLRECKTLEELKEHIDEIIESGDYINDVLTEEVKKQSKEKEYKFELKKEESKKFNLAKLRKEVLNNIIGQDEAVYDLTRTIAINQTSRNPRNKSHILITGPSGTGKTEMVNIVAKELDLPVFKANAPDYTKAGYYGKDVPTMLTGLLDAAKGDQKKAENGILIIDEIDKLVTNDDKGFSKSVLYDLLKILDRDVIEVEKDKIRNDMIMFDTSNLTVICMGSFDELYEQKQQNKHKLVGFNSSNEEKYTKIRLDEDDFIKWMGPEFVGRIGSIVSTNELSQHNILKILKQSKISQLKISKQDLEERGIKLNVTKGYLDEIIKRGCSKKTGVRKLNQEVKKSLNRAYDEILTNSKVKKIRLTKETAIDNKKYYVEY